MACLSVVTLASERGIEIAVFSRAQVQDAFAGVGARSRDDIAEAVARYIPALQPRLPARRKPWASEDKRLAIFCAAALVLTWYHFGTPVVFDGAMRGT